MIQSPIINKETKKTMSNVEVCRAVYEALTALKNSSNEEDKLKYAKAINNDENNYLWYKQIAEENNPVLAQKMIENTLIPVSIHK